MVGCAKAERPRTLKRKDIVERKEKDKRYRQLPTVVTPLLEGKVVVTKDLVIDLLRTYFLPV